MLTSLSISNYALIEKLEIEFSGGFTVITGETGAGKSILLGALALLLGKRAESGILASKEKKCIVEGAFNIQKLKIEGIFKKHDLDYEDVTFIRREILPSGKSRAFVNDTPVSLSILKEISGRLVDIHSQHETLLLGDAGFQLAVLDSYLRMDGLLSEYEIVYRSYSTSVKELNQLITELEQAKREQDYYQFLFDELETAKLNVEQFNEWKEKEKFYSHAEEVIQGISKSNQILNEDEHNISNMMGEVLSGLSAVSGFLKEAEVLVSRLRSAKIEIEDLADELSKLNDSIEFNPEELEMVNRRLDMVYSLQQKHHVASVEELLELKQSFEDRLGLISTREDELEALKAKVEELKFALKGIADKMSLKRKNKSNGFAKVLKATLTDLGMKDAGFEVRFESLHEFGPRGLDRVTFVFNANKGGRLQAIDKIASGGELSRLMLAVKSLITKEKILPTVIFDEIDTGVSGDIAAKVGKIMRKMSDHHQLIAISHLPQIAAKANFHFKVFKEEKAETTYTMIQRLDDNGRVDEIAKLLSDEKVSESAISTARELLNAELI